MRRILNSALLLLLSASLTQAAESSAPSSGSQKSGNRSTEGAKKSPSASPAPSTPTTPGAESTKRKAPAAKPAAVKAGSEDERFANARKAAAEDPKVLELREKADLAKTEEAGSKAMRAYLRALYGKMRALEPGLEERISLTETAALKAVSKGE
jgi:hypothetical protein